MPNNIHNPQPGQYNAANSTYENLPLHRRISTSARFDAVINNAIRGSVRIVNDKEHNVSNNQFAPGIGYVDNNVPGRITTFSSTQVLSSSMVNEVVVGRAWNSFGFMSDDGRVRVRLPRLVAVVARRRSAAPRALRRVSGRAGTRL